MKRQSKKRIEQKKTISGIDAKRREVGDKIYHDPRRAGKHGKPCEGSAFVVHRCSGRMELNEVIYPRNVFQKIAPKYWESFFLEWNMSINCGFFHATYGHRTKFRRWFLERVIRIYTIEKIRAWNNSLPLEEENRIIIDETMS